MGQNLTVQKIYSSLTEPQMMLGMPKKIGLMLMLMTVMATVAWTQYWFIIVSFAMAFIFRHAAKEDPYFFEMAMAIMKMKEVYD
jgi:type IV secretory pathway VirB3-like protein